MDQYLAIIWYLFFFVCLFCFYHFQAKKSHTLLKNWKKKSTEDLLYGRWKLYGTHISVLQEYNHMCLYIYYAQLLKMRLSSWIELNEKLSSWILRVVLPRLHSPASCTTKSLWCTDNSKVSCTGMPQSFILLAAISVLIHHVQKGKEKF